MDKKDILMVVVIAAVVGFLSASLGAQVDLSPRGAGGVGPTPNSQIAAYSCDADEICETNSISVGEVDFIGSGSISVENMGFIRAIRAQDIRTTDLMVDDGLLQAENAMMSSLGIGFSEFSNLSNELEVIGSSVFRSGENIYQSVTIDWLDGLGMTIGATAYVGTGTGYACMSAHGNIFRSEVPCNSLE